MVSSKEEGTSLWMDLGMDGRGTARQTQITQVEHEDIQKAIRIHQPRIKTGESVQKEMTTEHVKIIISFLSHQICNQNHLMCFRRHALDNHCVLQL